MISHSPLSSKYTEESTWLHLQSTSLELSNKKSFLRSNEVKCWNITEGGDENVIMEVYNNKLEIFQYETVQFYLLLSNT